MKESIKIEQIFDQYQKQIITIWQWAKSEREAARIISWFYRGSASGWRGFLRKKYLKKVSLPKEAKDFLEKLKESK